LPNTGKDQYYFTCKKYLQQVMEQGAAKANKSAGETMKLVREGNGIKIFLILDF